MPGKQARALCPVCQEPMPPDETACDNCGAFVIDEAVVRLCRALGIDREKALRLFDAGFRHPGQLRDRDVDGILRRKESGLLFLCTNCGGFVAAGDDRCPRCHAEFEPEEDAEPAWAGEDEDILDLTLCPNCGADNTPDWTECEICGESLPPPTAHRPEPTPPRPEPPVPRLDSEVGIPPPWEPRDTGPSEPPSKPQPPAAELRESRAGPPLPSPVPSGPSSSHHAPPETKRAALPYVPATSPPQGDATAARPRPAGHDRFEGSRSAPTRKEPLRVEPSPLPIRKPAEIRIGQGPTSAPAPSPGFPSAEAAGAALAAAAASLYVSYFLATGWTLWALALVIAALTGFAAAVSAPSRVRSWDAGLLAAGAIPGTCAPLLYPSLPEGAFVLAVLGAIPLAAATRRLVIGPARGLLVTAGGVPLTALAAVAAGGLPDLAVPAWTLGLLAAAVWPAAVALGEGRRRWLRKAVRRELASAEQRVARQDFSSSMEAYDRAIALTQKGGAKEDLPWYGKGAALVMLGRYEEALKSIDRALDINPYNEVAWVNKGNALTKQKRLVDALRCFNAAIKVNPRYEVAWNNKGNALARLGRLEDALGCYERALELDPGYRSAWTNKGYVLAKLGRYDEAAACADRVLRLGERGRTEAA